MSHSADPIRSSYSSLIQMLPEDPLEPSVDHDGMMITAVQSDLSESPSASLSPSVSASLSELVSSALVQI